jgi:hypothetical protein
MTCKMDAGAWLAALEGMRSPVVAIAATLVLFAVAGPARADEVPTPGDAHLLGTVETDAIREAPELKGARINHSRDLSVAGVRVLDQSYQCALGYAEAARFYDRALANALVIERDRSDTATGWLVRLSDGTLASVVIRNTHPTTIEIQRVVP